MARTFASHTNRPAVEAQRKRDLGLIHQGKSALHWSDDDYRYHLKQLTGKTSAADLDHGARRKVLAHMETLGFKPKSAFKAFDQAAKIRWLWRKLAETGGVRDASDAALLAFVGRTAGMGVADLKFLPVAQASTVIEALKAWLDRAKRAQGAPRV
ncbi:regulatory protein GemA [Paracidovorax citrulli]|uniref:Regulatory protein GemA n=2 Tax=Paracidovorax citrulli TaxID=80869 RepID=A1TRA1_PARC0|nr:regulatory protein GemA [Paracidovorax citrulli]ABM33489.1 protein of unknown function DUF1018 [Paracidovorax citrulli AAC00-1]ATG94116.1 regulatory protein GemA [Paracidovorax citrulli]MVT28213.1 DUF1018 domain-containing protein [Paracidovorax citrulli]MVT38911.1 DUF1018 domain-containing protein [Paracidovorax citrulli]PVY67530.1 phage gp16-like protein [Paracidovorax citrulli]